MAEILKFVPRSAQMPNPFDKGAIAKYVTAKRAERKAKIREAYESPGSLTDTGRNLRYRAARWEDWRTAERQTSFWRARLDWAHSLQVAQQFDVADARTFPISSDYAGDWDRLLNLWRSSLAKQMLTAAPGSGAVAWKRAQMRGKQLKYTAYSLDLYQAAIDQDVEWLEAHPIRRRKAI